MKNRILATCLTLVGMAININTNIRADMVTDWSADLDQTIFAVNQAVPAQPRSLAIVHTAIFDAVNGIAGKYTPYFATLPSSFQPAALRPRQQLSRINTATTPIHTDYASRASPAIHDGGGRHLACPLAAR